ncbi:MAG TPA: glycoside hydrolase family 2 TIM barrel-domain containing protein [Candidatus Sulfotelmatobacter sp.]|nr:glycoside hydrolase family 2 TIM barrel-domain containing protein [Candidatus Sulfotelmatobacter sp.]
MQSLRSAFIGLIAAGGFVFNALADDATTAPSPREHLSLDRNWKFHLGDDWPGALNLAKAGASSGPASEKFSDQSWRSLDLPHDWAIELPFDRSADTSHGFKPVGPGFTKNSIGWYRRQFDLPAEDSSKRIWLTFDGVFRNATVWVNGWLVTQHDGGYYPFREDITDVLHFGGTNLITVRVDATKFEGWFYEGAGIYRHVWLDKTAPVAIAPDGVWVYSQFIGNVPEGEGHVAVHIKTTIQTTDETPNNGMPPDGTIRQQLYDPSGELIADGLPQQFGLCPGQTRVTNWQDKQDGIYHQREIYNSFLLTPPDVGDSGNDSWAPDMMVIKTPILWSPESPKLYKLVTTILLKNKIVDQKETSFGIRTVAFDKDKGFLLNGQPYELKGTCNHQDMAGVGAALPDALQEFRVKALKGFGCNAIRTSHNPPTPELLDACDRLGMLVMDESRLLGSDSENLKKWSDQVRRDRNHPSVAIWSICNEEPQQHSAQGGRVGLSMQRLAKQLDPTRPVTAAENVGDDFAGLMGALEVRGWNYHIGKKPGEYGKEPDNYHAKHPDQPNVGTEQASTVSTRGIYENDKTRGYVSAYDTNAPAWANTAEEWYGVFAVRPWLSGGFVWTGFDYRGEPTPYAWPCINSHFGIIDTCGFWKDVAWYYQAWWTTNTVLHLLPHWNWAGKEGQEIRVDAFSNCKSVELFLNGDSLGKQDMKPRSHLSWQVKYAPGTLSAQGFDAAGNVIAETKVETTGDAAQIQLTPDRAVINADGEDVSVFTVSALDAQGRVVPVAQNQINFSIAGAGKILGVGNGDPSCHEPDVFIPQTPVHSLAVNNWRYKLANLPAKRDALAPEHATNFDDSAWTTIKKATDGGADDLPLKEGETAIYRAHFALTEDEAKSFGAQIRFNKIDDHGWIYVNDQHVGESHNWEDQPVFDIKSALHAGDNVVAVGVKNDGGSGGVSPDVNVEIMGNPQPTPWSRSLFNGLAQIMVQSTRAAGEIKLTASADGLQPATSTVTTQSAVGRPSVP